MANQPAPKSPGQGNATPGAFQRYFQNYNTGGPPMAQPAAPMSGFGVAPTATMPTIGSGTPAPLASPAPGSAVTRQGGAPQQQGQAPAPGYGALPGGDLAQMGGAITHAGVERDGGFGSWLSSVGDTFINPYTGKEESKQDALDALLEQDPTEFWEAALQEELALIASQTQAGLSQQAAVAGAAGLGTSGAFSSDIGAMRTAGGAAGAQAILANQKKASDDRIAWLDRVSVAEDAVTDAVKNFGDAKTSHFASLVEYGENALNSYSTQVAATGEEGWLVNTRLRTDLRALYDIIEANNVNETDAKAAINALLAQWHDSGLMFNQRHGHAGYFIYYNMHHNKASLGEVAPGESWQPRNPGSGVWWDDESIDGEKIDWS